MRTDPRYVAEINTEAAETGMPMLRPMFLQWPDDKGCQVGSGRIVALHCRSSISYQIR